MNDLTVFNYNGAQLRTVVKDGEPWFVAKDVCDVLEHSNSRMALERLDEDEKGVSIIYTPGGPQEMAIVNEPGLYALVLTSRKPEAKQFKRWVTHEVLPSIRKTGAYITPEILHEQFNIPKTYPDALRLAANLAEEVERLKPKAEMHDLFLSGENIQPMGIVAKAVGLGRNKLFDFLRQKGILMGDNVPYQRYIDAGYFVVKEKPVTMGSLVSNKPQTFVTAKGVDYIGKLLTERRHAVSG